MPITASTLLLVAAMSVLPGVAHAQYGVHLAIRSADQLAKEKTVRIYEEPYKLAAGATVIGNMCTADLAISPAQQAFIKQRYDALGKGYIQAFEDAFVARIQTPSNEALRQDYVRYLNDLQNLAATNISQVIKGKKGCKDQRLTKIMSYFEKLQKAEASGKPAPLTRRVR